MSSFTVTTIDGTTVEIHENPSLLINVWEFEICLFNGSLQISRFYTLPPTTLGEVDDVEKGLAAGRKLKGIFLHPTAFAMLQNNAIKTSCQKGVPQMAATWTPLLFNLRCSNGAVVVIEEENVPMMQFQPGEWAYREPSGITTPVRTGHRFCNRQPWSVFDVEYYQKGLGLTKIILSRKDFDVLTASIGPTTSGAGAPTMTGVITVKGVPVSAPMQFSFSTTLDGWSVEGTTPGPTPLKVCTCGSTKCGLPIHSSWCDIS